VTVPAPELVASHIPKLVASIVIPLDVSLAVAHRPQASMNSRLFIAAFTERAVSPAGASSAQPEDRPPLRETAIVAIIAGYVAPRTLLEPC